MKKLNRLLSVILSVVLLIGAAVPTSTFASTDGEIETQNTYESTLQNFSEMEADGWEASYSADPQAGVAFEKLGSLSSTFENWSALTRASTPGIKWTNDWQGNPFSKMSAATYTAQKYKYFTLTAEYKFESANRPWPVITFNQPSTIPEMFFVKINGSQVTNPQGGNSAIGVYIMYEGHLNMSGKMASVGKAISTALDGTEWHKVEITVTPGKVVSAIYNADGTTAIEIVSDLPNSYEGGYISLMLNGWSQFRNIAITELNFDTEASGTYKNNLTNIGGMVSDGWSGAYSADPQDVVEFEDVDASELFECWGGGVTRNQNKYYHWKGFNWKDPFINMAAFTYTAQKYKYFTMTVDYKFGGQNSVWPAISFGQPETTPEMFYAPIAYSDVQSNPKVVGNDAIGVYVQYEGYLNIAGKKATGASNVAAYDTADWHTMKLSVVPGMVEVVLYDNDGNPVSTTNAILSEDYEGGYISLMLGVPCSFFRNLSITEYEYLDMSQTEDSAEKSTELTTEQCKKPIVVKATPKRLYDFDSITPDENSAVEYEIKNLTSDIYLIEKAKPSVLTVKYIKRKLDYDPEYTLKYYFDWQEELDDFVAYRTPNPADAFFESTELNKIWKIQAGVLKKSVIDFSGTNKTGDPWSDFNTLMLNTNKFRNFELTVQYMHGRVGGFACGVIFGIENPTVFTDQEDGGIFAAVESDARALMQGKSIRNGDDLRRIMPGEGRTNLPGYPKYDTNEIHTMRIKVLEGRAYMYIDNIEQPVTAIIPKDFYGNIALAVGNNLAWFDNLTIQPLNEWGEKVTLAESKSHYKYDSEDIEMNSWNGDTNEWGKVPDDYFEAN